jgi:hypothetical protein
MLRRRFEHCDYLERNERGGPHAQARRRCSCSSRSPSLRSTTCRCRPQTAWLSRGTRNNGRLRKPNRTKPNRIKSKLQVLLRGGAVCVGTREPVRRILTPSVGRTQTRNQTHAAHRRTAIGRAPAHAHAHAVGLEPSVIGPTGTRHAQRRSTRGSLRRAPARQTRK